MTPKEGKTLMEAMLFAKDALALFRYLKDWEHEADTLQLLAKIHRAKLEPMDAITVAHEATAVYRDLEIKYGIANTRLVAAICHLMMLGVETPIVGNNGVVRLASPQEEALWAATEAGR